MRRALALFAALWIVVTPLIAAAQNQFFDSNGVRIRYVEQGRGTPMVLLHGLVGLYNRRLGGTM